ncbi:alpha/beta hydrolase family protein [Microterricola gilva]|uniref:Alpha/beta hydrolase family protein n=1 Tax=Microterricola gilva TaxID=393267 RepID=A0A4Q8AN75_9MICO|nr:alpha/beta hydrolase [Microterricola gilva]RZU66037.1 alpha/beta hydrolase family protein [Microterricola gilva]
MDHTTNTLPTSSLPTNTLPSLILVPGHWLGAWAWDGVASELRARGHAVTAVTLPGLDPDDPDRATRTLDDQAEALRQAVAAASADGSAVVLVAHSGAGVPVSLLLDQDPTAVSRVVYVDSGPSGDGSVFDADFPAEQADSELPPFDQLQASPDGVSEQDLRVFRERAVPQPGPVMRQVVHLTNDARRDVPSTIIACSFPSEVLMQMARAGNEMMAEVASLRDLELVDLPTGHWPMWSRPVELAATISTAAER